MDIYYIIRAKLDGKYVVANLEDSGQYLLLFKENYDALSYINTHAGDKADAFRVDSTSKNEVKGLLSRWGYQGIAMVQDPLVPQLQFLSMS